MKGKYIRDEETEIEEKLMISFELAGASTDDVIARKLRQYRDQLMEYINLRPIQIAKIIDEQGMI